MRVRFLLMTVLLGLAPWATAARPPGHAWVVVAPESLDARITRQVEELGARDQALVHFVSSPRAAIRLRVPLGGLTLELREEKNLDLFVENLRRLAGDQAKGLTAELAREGYGVVITYPRAAVPEAIRITAARPEGFHQALLRIPDILALPPSDLATALIPAPKALRQTRSGRAVTVELADFPSFPERGIVEGFYGTQWTYQDRLEMLRFEGQHGMNVYYYAPKDDPYHRKLWQEPYPPAQMKRLGELVSTARANFVDFCFAVSPGLSMVYSSEDDFSKLTAKLASVGKLGVSCFALFLDDIPPVVQSPQDRERFQTLAQAHASLINKLDGHLKSQSRDNRLVVTPTTYTNEWGSRDYIQELGSAVNEDVAIVWTGSEVASPAITVAQAREWGEWLRRKPLVWDNFPVNDGRPWRVHLGPQRGRDPGLPEVIRGLFSNPMNQPRASLIPLETIADYLWNPAAYDPERSLKKAVTAQYGDDAPRLLAALLKTYGDYWWDENVFTPLFAERRYAIDLPEIERRIAELESSLQPLRIRGRFQQLAEEISPLLGKTRERIAKVSADPAFRRLPGGKLEWREDYDTLSAPRLTKAPQLDGDFTKWQAGPLYVLNDKSQILTGVERWKGPEHVSARVALGWDENYFYVGVDVADPELYQPFSGRGISEGDVFTLTLETAFRKNFASTRADGDEYSLLFSPGNFAGVGPSVFSEEDYLPPRPQPRDYDREIKTTWKKSAKGFSGDIAVPSSYFDAGKFSEGYEIGLAFAVQKVLLAPGGKAGAEEPRGRIVFSSKTDRLFPVSFGNPSSYQRLLLTGLPKQ
jgi:hypothetical protein